METKTLANFIADTAYGDLMPETVDLAKMCILDFCGVALAGAQESSSKILRDYFLTETGADCATLLDGSFHCGGAAATAALNGAFGHAQDFDDLHNSSIVHPGVITIPTALALGQKYHSSGAAVILSVVLGYDVAARIGEIINPSAYQYWHTTAVAGPFSSAAVAAKLLGLNGEQTASALGSAGTQAGGLWAFLEDGAMSKPLHVANANVCGIRSAELAARGFTGATAILESPRGFAHALSRAPHLEAATSELGNPFKIHTNSLKPYACCRHTHSACYGIYVMKKDYGITAEDIEAIYDDTYSDALKLTDNPDPANPYAAKFSLQYCIAAALQFPNLHEDAFSWSGLKDPRIRELMKRTKVGPSDDIEAAHRADASQWGHRIRLVLKDGRVCERLFTYPFGDFHNPFTWEDTKRKYTLLAEPVIGPRKTEELYRRICGLEKMPDVEPLFRL